MNFKVLGIEHIGIATNDNSKKLSLFFERILKLPLKREIVKNQKVLTEIFETGNGKIELLSATEESSVINKFLNKKGDSIHHLAIRVDNIFNAIEYLQENGIELINNTPQDGADNMIIIFIHPNSTPGLLLELCQNK
tara:strand:- start:520 stop:930 length:411 start_codon:yes stop_codon:yes gene_type:complete